MIDEFIVSVIEKVLKGVNDAQMRNLPVEKPSRVHFKIFVGDGNLVEFEIPLTNWVIDREGHMVTYTHGSATKN